MTALQTPEKTSRRKELRRNIFVDLYARALLFYEDYRRLAQGIGVVLLALALAVPGYIYYHQQQEEAANKKLGQIISVYQRGNYEQALNGSGSQAGLLAIADNYSGTDAGNLASFYAANALYQTEKYDQALTYFKKFEKENNFFGASALAAQAKIYENRGQFQRAAKLYERAASQYKNDLTTPRYLLSAGQAYAEAGQYDTAITVYRKIQENYPESDQATRAKRYLARAKVQQKQTSS
ncbi:MAG: tol-pal system YbgF family protein [Salinibacter sp.]|uniref:tol-pal system YbgF family protein n=1 Tax=Salinibacter sp. TaxID=2065818 RepID=UPI0035D4AFF2